MTEVSSNHYQVVAASLAGEREVDEQTFASLSVLEERLERLKQRGGIFSGIEFSPAVQQLRTCRDTVSVS